MYWYCKHATYRFYETAEAPETVKTPVWGTLRSVIAAAFLTASDLEAPAM
jgi:hypothetical protein